MNVEEIKLIAQKVIDKGERSITQSEYDLAKKFYRQEVGKQFKGCSNCWNDIFVICSIKIKNKLNSPNQMEQLFFLKENKIIQLHGHAPVGAKNMTDLQAKRILKSHKGHIKNFASFPADWEKIVDAFVEGKEKPVEEKKPEVKINSAPAAPAPIAALPEVDSEKQNVLTQLESMSKRELKDVAAANEYPEAEFKNMNKESLVNYLLGKQFPK